MEPDYQFLSGRVAEPVCLCAVWKGDVLGGEAAFFGECWICFVHVWSQIPVK